jgi:PIN domain nuclease of toxin-antitoxin system
VTPALLLDTHAFLWWRTNDPALPARAREAVASAPIVFVSSASAWEVAIKMALGKLRLSASIEDGVEMSGFEKLLIRFDHAVRAGSLPPHHRDPFDRMLVAQAQIENLTLVTHDAAFRLYDVDQLWA